MKERLDGPAKQKLLGMILQALVDIEIDDEVKTAEPSPAHQSDDQYVTAEAHTVELTAEMKIYLSPDGLIQLGIANEDKEATQMSKLHRFGAREWLKDDEDHFVADGSCDEDHARALVDDLYREGAVHVEVGIVRGKDENYNEADALYVHLPANRNLTLNIMLLLAYQHGDEVDLVEGEENVVRIWWD